MPPKANRKAEWDYNGELGKLRNEFERLFRGRMKYHGHCKGEQLSRQNWVGVCSYMNSKSPAPVCHYLVEFSVNRY